LRHTNAELLYSCGFHGARFTFHRILTQKGGLQICEPPFDFPGPLLPAPDYLRAAQKTSNCTP
jgi:hypothetical protein